MVCIFNESVSDGCGGMISTHESVSDGCGDMISAHLHLLP
jgi:hypothetical protein